MWMMGEGPGLGQPLRGWILVTDSPLISTAISTSRVQGSMCKQVDRS